MDTEEKKSTVEKAPARSVSPWVAARAGAIPETPKKRLDLRLILEIGLGLAVVMLLVLLLRPKGTAEAPQTILPPSATESPAAAPDQVTVRFHSPEGTQEQFFSPGDTMTLEDAAPIDGYTFLRWRDAQGQNVSHSSFRVWEDMDFYAVYAMAFRKEDHSPYMKLDENGAFHPSGSISRREIACLLYEMLDTTLVGDGQFLDVPEDDPAYLPVATLKQLGILSGSRFHPDESITRREFMEILCGFFPEGTEKAVFADLDESDPDYGLFCTAAQQGWIASGEESAARPDEELKRIDFVCILNRILDRHGDCEQRQEMVGTILDVSATDPRFWDVAEASVVHTHKGEGVEERWLTSEAMPVREEGLFFLGSQLHAIGPDGNPIVDEEYQGLYFNEDGVETSGLPELDEKIWELLDQQVDPSSMKQEEMLNRLFFYVASHYSYRAGNYYSMGEPSGWEAEEALSFLDKHTGNCYNFAALFYELARAIGYDATAYTGGVLGNRHGNAVDVHGEKVVLPAGHCPHSWVEIEFDGVSYIYDPEMCFLSIQRSGSVGFLKLGEYNRIRYGYIRSLEEAEEQAAQAQGRPGSELPQP